MSFVKKIIKKNIDLNKVVILNKSRSYREGNLMCLNFSIIDKYGNQIFSIAPEFIKNTNEPVAVASAISESFKNFDDKDYQTILRNHIYSSNWCKPMKLKKICDSIQNLTLPMAFLSYTLEEVIIQIYDYLKLIDFYSLQTKEEYLKLEKTIENSSTEFMKTVENNFNKNKKNENSKIKEIITDIMKKEAICNSDLYAKFSSKQEEREIAFWVQEKNTSTMLSFAKGNEDLAYFLVNIELNLVKTILQKKTLFEQVFSFNKNEEIVLCQKLVLPNFAI